ncbi:MAG: hypothetical protein R3F11_16710 [Verrucomicrobiales bacterium]
MATDDSPAKSSKSCHGCSIEGCMAFLILRLWVGLRLLMAGMEKFRADGEYKIGAPQGASLEKIAENMKQHAIILPDFAVDAFINILPFALVGLGILIPDRSVHPAQPFLGRSLARFALLRADGAA